MKARKPPFDVRDKLGTERPPPLGRFGRAGKAAYGGATGFCGCLCFALLAWPVQAQPLPPQQGLIERIAPPVAPSLAPSLSPPPEQRASGPGAENRVRIARVSLRGNQALAEAGLRPLYAALEGREVPLGALEDTRLAVLEAYRRAGYPYVAVAAALAPAGDGDAELRLAVTEGFVAEIRLEGDIGPAATQVLRFLNQVTTERPVSNSGLERALLLAGDVPGVTARGLLRPLLGGEPGALQLVVQLQRRSYSGFVNADNRGFRSTGAWQGLLVVGANSFSSLGERTEVSVLESEANRQTFGQVSQEFFVGGSGLRVRGYIGIGRVQPGSPLSALGYNGDTRVAGFSAAYPVLRSRPANLSLVAQFDAFESTVDLRLASTGPSQRASRDDVRSFRLGAEGSARDAFLPLNVGAANTYGNIRLHQGVEALGSSHAASTTVGRYGSNFGYTKATAEVTRQQPLFRPFEGSVVSLQGTLAGQWSRDILPLSEKFYLGGTRLGRGFYSGQVTGDRAMGMSLELQLNTGFDLPLMQSWVRQGWLGTSVAPAWLTGEDIGIASQFYLLHDQGRAFENKDSDPNRRLASWGAGMRLIANERVQLDMEWVRRMTRQPDGAGATRLRADAFFARMLVRF